MNYICVSIDGRHPSEAGVPAAWQDSPILKASTNESFHPWENKAPTGRSFLSQHVPEFKHFLMGRFSKSHHVQLCCWATVGAGKAGETNHRTHLWTRASYFCSAFAIYADHEDHNSCLEELEMIYDNLISVSLQRGANSLSTEHRRKCFKSSGLWRWNHIFR